MFGLNSSGPAPAGMSLDYLRAGHDEIPERGGLTVTVPGTVGGWAALQDRFDSRSLDRVLARAAMYARDGAPVANNFAEACVRLRDVVEGHPGTQAVFGGPKRTGDIMRQPALAKTLERIGIEARAFCEGDVAADMVATLQDAGSAITLDDFAAFEPGGSSRSQRRIAATTSSRCRPTRGTDGAADGQHRRGWPVAEFGRTTGKGIHAWVEAKLKAFAHRDQYVADPRMADPLVASSSTRKSQRGCARD